MPKNGKTVLLLFAVVAATGFLGMLFRMGGASDENPSGFMDARSPKTLAVDCGGGAMLEMVLIPEGSFLMGVSKKEMEILPGTSTLTEMAQHPVKIEIDPCAEDHSETIGMIADRPAGAWSGETRNTPPGSGWPAIDWDGPP